MSDDKRIQEKCDTATEYLKEEHLNPKFHYIIQYWRIIQSQINFNIEKIMRVLKWGMRGKKK